MSEQTPSAERYPYDITKDFMDRTDVINAHNLMDLITAVQRETRAALDAQSAERTRAEVEKMREAAAKISDATQRDGVVATYIRGLVAAAIRALPIEGTSQ